MENIKTYLEFFKFSLIKKYIVIIGMVLAVVLGQIITNISKNMNLTLWDWVIINFDANSIIIIVLVVTGILLGGKIFQVAMNIRADRNSYTKAVFIFGTIVSLLFYIVYIVSIYFSMFTYKNFLQCNGIVRDSGKILEDIVGGASGIDIQTFKLEYIKYDIVVMFWYYLALFMVGFMVGAFLYRIKSIYLSIIVGILAMVLFYILQGMSVYLFDSLSLPIIVNLNILIAGISYLIGYSSLKNISIK